MSSDLAMDLLQRGLTAQDTGDKETALIYLRQAVEEDPDMVEAWESLAELEEDPVEKVNALQNVLRLDPDNKEANKALNKLDKQQRGQKRGSSVRNDEEWIPGVKRRELRTALLGLGVFTLLVFGAVFGLIAVVTGQQDAVAADATALAANLLNVQETFTAESIAIETQRVIDEVNATATQLALTTATPTPTVTSVLPPTFTPTSEPTEIPLRQYDLPPDTATGDIYGWGGLNAVSDEYLDLRRYPLSANGDFIQVMDTYSSYFNVDASGSFGVYETYLIAQDLTNIYRVDLSDPAMPVTDLSTIFGSTNVFGTFQPSISADGNQIAFIGSSLDSGFDVVLLMDTTTEQVTVISRDEANYRHPTISPDSNYIAAVRETEEGDVDLVLFDLTQDLTETGFAMVDLTVDNAAIIEAYPAFSQDMSLLAYSAAASTSPDNHEIFLIGLENGRPTSGNITVAASEFDELHPVFSPDGNFIAYSANVSGDYNIYVRNLTNTNLYQLTEERGNVFAGDWIDG